MCLGQRLKLADQGGLHLGGGGENRIDCGGKSVLQAEEGNGPIIPLPNPFKDIRLYNDLYVVLN